MVVMVQQQLQQHMGTYPGGGGGVLWKVFQLVEMVQMEI